MDDYWEFFTTPNPLTAAAIGFIIYVIWQATRYVIRWATRAAKKSP